MPRFRLPLLGFVLSVSAVYACAKSGETGFDPQPIADGGVDGRADAPAPIDDGGFIPTTDTGPAPVGKTVFYAHDKSTLYTIDPEDNYKVTTVGEFSCVTDQTVASMTDIAVDKDGKIYGVAATTIFLEMKVPSSGSGPIDCGVQVELDGNSSFYGASFAPIGVLGHDDRETLIVGNNDGELYEVDTQTGDIYLVGSFGLIGADADGTIAQKANKSKPWQLSGDIVFLENGGDPLAFATVKEPKANDKQGEALMEIDLNKLRRTTSGSAPDVRKGARVRGGIKSGRSCGASKGDYGLMFGIAAYESSIIGFSTLGYVVSIDNNKGETCLISDQSANVGAEGFWGAGVTTKVKVTPPPR